MSETIALLVMEALSRRDPSQIKALSNDDAIASGGVLPRAIPLGDAVQIMDALWTALSDFHVEITKVETKGAEVTVEFMWGGIHDGTLHLPIPGATPISPTRKTVWVSEVFCFTVENDKINTLHVESPVGGGIPGMMAQLGLVAA